MNILKDTIVDVPINKELEVDLIQCFIEKDECVLICSHDYIDEEIEYIEMLKEKHGNNLNLETRYGKKPCAYENINDYSSLLKKNAVRRRKCYKALSKSEIEAIVYSVENTINYKLIIVSNDRKPDEYKYELEMCEHYYIDEDEGQEVRSLCFKANKGYSASNGVITNIKNTISKYNLE
ncbi:hypothetical protein [Clostridium beijerinckii]|uniref:Uncharacterized protein n=2 Tax=Clostridium beijerinckii TaxID=1520 RepID=A0AAE5H4B2_CLOBE|nr:hypothetical protein [Clostridium beijerinckii]ALB45677.1 hypothetical protein X276_10575 [Clostridium beijerinckii NRRL B-598]NSB14197.1 hypothetical protein [Clostridium beijerinckii]OOM21505.1 hypothetical protein CLOBE_46780 [Clostridium beijerinckii]